MKKKGLYLVDIKRGKEGREDEKEGAIIGRHQKGKD